MKVKKGCGCGCESYKKGGRVDRFKVKKKPKN